MLNFNVTRTEVKTPYYQTIQKDGNKIALFNEKHELVSELNTPDNITFCDAVSITVYLNKQIQDAYNKK